MGRSRGSPPTWTSPFLPASVPKRRIEDLCRTSYRTSVPKRRTSTEQGALSHVLPFEARVTERATVHGWSLTTCSAEDLVVLKAFADRTRDWSDIEGIVLRTGAELDWETILAELQPLCEAKEAPHILPRLAALRRAHGERPIS